MGTLTRVPVRPPGVIDRRTAATAMLSAPLTAVPAAAGVALLVWLGQEKALAPLVAGLLGVALLAWVSRMLHLDGLSDTVDGLTASTDRERSLAVMRSGTAGPAGVVALVVVIGLQSVGLAALVGQEHGPWLAAAVVIASRAALPLACTRGVPAARPEGLGATVAGSVPRVPAVVVWLLAAGLVWAAALLPGFDLGGLLAPVLAALALASCLAVAVRRLGGVTGDVLGACVEVSLTVLLLAVSSVGLV
nr:adenosylcobinamide-GDP ribazoletransferase [Ornithinimicrobium sp. F0845]